MRTPPLSVTAAADLLRSVDVGVLEALFDHVPDVAFFVKDVAGRYVAVNLSLVERNGLKSKAEVVGRRPSEINPGEYGRIPEDQDAVVLRTGEPLLEHLELHWYSPNEPGWCLTTKLPLRDSRGAITGLVGISHDVRVPIEARAIPVGLARALDHFAHNLDEPTSPSALAERAGLAPHRFARLVKQVHGLTPSQFIAKTRIAAASRLLRESDAAVADIALACGFYDHSAFTRAFRSMTGVTPTEFREGR